jgi:glycine/D-amino acid oxidase-like deaminating enzyme
MSEHVAVIGAGVFGAWTATHLQRAGHRVTLVDAHGPAHSRASSAGESRLIRAAYGPDAIYSRMARDSLVEWKALSAVSALPILHQCGILFFFPEEEAYVRETIAAHHALGLPTEVLDRAEMARRYPIIDFDGVDVGLFEPDFGVLIARRAVQTLVGAFERSGGTYLTASAAPVDHSGEDLRSVELSVGGALEADRFVFALGPWLGKFFPDVIGKRILPTRQEIFYFAPPAGDTRFLPAALPGWSDFNHGDMFYGTPDLEGRGVKFAHDLHGPDVDPERQSRLPSEEALAEAVAYRDRRFPALRGAPVVGAEVCQYENSSNGDFLIDFHPQLKNVLLVGGGSGHGFKHGPEVGRYAAARLFGSVAVEPRFSLDSKSEVHRREVH